MKFAHKYKLKKDLPTHKIGSELKWCGMEQRFYFDAPRERYALARPDRGGPSFTVEQIQDVEWFRPVGALRSFIPPFPSRKHIDQYVSLDAECRMVDEVDECRAISALISDAKFQQRLYDFYKQEYNKFHHLRGVK